MNQSVFPGVGTGATASRWGRVMAAVFGVMAPSGLALLALAFAEAPFIGLAPLPVVMAVLLPASLVLSGAALAARRAAPKAWPRLGLRWTPRLLAAFVAFAVFFVGAAFSNTLLVDGPVERWTLVGYALSAVVAAIVLVATVLGLRTESARALFARRWSAIFAALCFAAGVGATAVDACCFTHAFPAAHAVTILVALAGFTLSAFVIYHTDLFDVRTRGVIRLMGLVTLVTTVGGATLAIERLGPGAFMRTTSGTRSLLGAVRDRLDRDGDGYSAWLGGADCDDDDSAAYPLSTSGRDCLAIVPHEGARPDAALAGGPIATGSETLLSTAPKIIVLVTIDAFRCGFGQTERPELTHACPNLAALASEAHFQPHAYARAPETLGSLSSIFAHRTEAGVETLPAALQKRGYRTEAITTHRALLNIPKLRASFDVPDDSLAPISQRSNATTSEEVTDRLLARVDEAMRRDSPTFVWAHYYDTHSPYVQSPDSRWVWSRNDAYVEEVKRTDRAVGRLVSRLKQLVPNDDLALFLTADHGDELGEHGGTDHGRTLYEEVIRVPFLAWRSGPDPKQGLPSALPAGGIDVAPYIFSVATGAPFAPSQALLMKAAPPNDAIVGVVRGDLKYILHYRLGYEELFDLRDDPLEQRDLAAERREDVDAMRLVLGELLRSEHRAPATL